MGRPVLNLDLPCLRQTGHGQRVLGQDQPGEDLGALMIFAGLLVVERRDIVLGGVLGFLAKDDAALILGMVGGPAQEVGHQSIIRASNRSLAVLGLGWTQ